MPKHIHHHYAPSVTSTHTSSLQLHPHTHHIVTPGFVDRPCQSDCTAGQMDGEAGWWTTNGNIRLPPLARVMGVGRQQQHSNYQIFSQNCQFHHRRLELLEHFNVFIYIYHTEHYGLIFGPYGRHIIFTRSPHFPFCLYISIYIFYLASTLSMVEVYYTFSIPILYYFSIT